MEPASPQTTRRAGPPQDAQALYDEGQHRNCPTECRRTIPSDDFVDGIQAYRHQGFFDPTEDSIFKEEIFKNEIEIDKNNFKIGENILEIDHEIEEKQLIRVKNSQNLRRIAPKSKK